MPDSSALKPPVRRPLLGLALAFLAGSAWGQRFPSPLAHGLLVAAGMLGLLLAARLRRRRLRPAQAMAGLCCLAAVLGAGALSAACAELRRLEAEASLFCAAGRKTRLTLAATVLEEPDGRLLRRGGARLFFPAKTRTFSHDGGDTWFRLHTPLCVDLYGPPTLIGGNPPRPMPRAGEGWILQGSLRPDRFGRGPPRLSVSLRPGTLRRHPAADAPAWRRILLSLRREAAERLALGIPDHPQAVLVLRAMLLGYQSALPPELRNIFSASGTIHIFAISGLHVGILATLLMVLLPLTRLPRTQWFWLLAPLLVACTLLTGGKPSAQRACVMTLLYVGAPSLQRKPDALTALAAAAILVLTADPLQISNLGFLFSFACVFGLLTLTSPLRSLLRGAAPGRHAVAPPDALSAAEEGADEPLSACGRRSLRFLQRYAADSLSVSLAAWLVSVPLTALYFGRITPIAVLGNLYAIPLAFLIVLGGSLSLVASLFSTVLCACFNSAAALLIELLVWLTGWTARIPGASIAIRRWSPGMVSTWYAGCLLLGLLLHHLARKRHAQQLCATHPEWDSMTQVRQ